MTKAANPVRGEAAIELEGVSYTLRPSYEAILEVERQTEDTIINLARLGMSFAMPLDKAAIVATEFIRAWGRANNDQAVASFNAKRVGELIYDAGLYLVGPMLGAVLSGAATGDYAPSGELKATVKTTSAPTTVA